MRARFLLALVAIAGCESDPEIHWRRACSTDTAERRSQFIIDCSKAANPLSDEEGEDLVIQCQHTSEALFCAEEAHVYLDMQMTRCSVATDPKLVAACKRAAGTP